MISRRLLLGIGATAALSPLVGCGTWDGGEGPADVPEALVSFDNLAGAPLSYEVTDNVQPFNADPRFVDLLQQWAEEWVAVAGLGPLTRVSTYGAQVAKTPSYHASGRAFDIAELVHEDGSVSCRYDRWGDDGQRLRQYWRLAASLSTRFTYTLGYPYNAEHHNHIHIDNGINGYDATTFREGSRAQTQIVQGVLRHVFDREVEITGEYDSTTRDAVRSVQRGAGIGDRIGTERGWRSFLEAAVAA